MKTIFLYFHNNTNFTLWTYFHFNWH